jgi:hypothetical protein
MEQRSANAEKVYRFFVDGKEYQSTNQLMTGAELRELAGIDSKLRIFLGDHGRGTADRQILTHTSVNLAEPGEERFYTLPRPSLDIY